MANKIRKPKLIEKPEDVKYILSISRDDAVSKSLLMELFGDFGNGPRFNTYDIIKIPKGSYGNTKKNKSQFTTTVGLYIFNKGMIEELSDILGYINEPITSKKYDEINEKLSYARLENKITIQQLKDFIMKSQIYMSCVSAFSPSHTMKMLLCTTQVEKKKKELEKKYKEGLEKKDLNTINKLENELLDFAKDYLKDDPSADMYNSGARSKWGNNFKNMYVIKGAIQHTDGSYDFVDSSYISGLDKKDFSKMNDAAVSGPYARAVNTANGGAMEKLFISAFQHIKVLGPGTDCGSDKYITVELNEKNINDWIYCFVKQGSNLIEITSDNKDKFIGKTVKMRYSSMCKSKDGICEKCAGTLFNRLGITNIGLSTAQMASKLKNMSMKSFHDSTINLDEMDIEEVFGFKK